MNKKHLILTLALVAAFSAGTATALQHQNYVGNNVNVMADDSKTALSVVDVNYSENFLDGYGECFCINFGVDLGLGYWQAIDMQGKVSLIDSEGNPKTISSFESCGTSVVLNRNQTYVCSVGDIITLKAGLVIGEFEIKEDVSYQYTTEKTPWTLYTDALPVPKQPITVQDVNYMGNIFGYGEGFLIGFGVDLGLDYWQAIDMQGKVSLIDSEGNPKTVTAFESCGNSIAVNRSQTYVCSVGDIITLKAGLVIGEFEIKEDVSYQYATANTPWVLYTDELPTPGSGDNEEPVVPEKQDITVQDVNYSENILGYYGEGIIVGFGVDLGLDYWQPIDMQDKVTLVGKDGTPKSITAFESCGNSVVVNRSQTYVCEVGDILTLKAGLVLGEFEIKADVSYKYNGPNSPWAIYDPNDPEVDLEFGAGTGLLNDLTWSCPAMIFSFDTTKTFGDFQSAETLDKIIYTNAYGENVPIRDFIHVGQNNFLFRWTADGQDPIYAMVGDKVTFKAGFALAGNETLPEDVTFVVTNAAAQGMITLYTEACDPVGLAITTTSDYSQITVGANAQMTYALTSGYGTAKFTSSDSSIATVTKDGLVTGVAEGTVTITATIGSMTDTFEITVLPASPIVGLEIVSPYTIWVAQNETLVLPADYKAYVAFENGQHGAEFALNSENCVISAVDTATLGDKKATLTITYQGQEYTIEVNVKVYEIGDVSIKEVGIVDWFAYAIFIQYPDSTANTANITSTGACDSVFDHISYRRADGTEIAITGGYILGGGNICIMPFGGSDLNDDNYNQYYLAGDVLKLSQGMKIWMWTGDKAVTSTDNNAIVEGTGMYICEGILQHDIEYRYDGNVWGLYVEYTDVQANNTTLTVEAGKNIDAGVVRVPSNATTGTFTYVSSDSSIATVSSRGVIKGLKEGTVTITVTLNGGTAGEKVVTLNVTVTDKIVGLNITPATLSVKKGGSPDLSALTATYKWASGKAGEAVDLSNATVIGLDNEALGEQTVVVSVVVGDATYTGTITINVEAGGCGSVVTGSLLAPLAILGAGWVVSKKKRK